MMQGVKQFGKCQGNATKNGQVRRVGVPQGVVAAQAGQGGFALNQAVNGGHQTLRGGCNGQGRSQGQGMGQGQGQRCRCTAQNSVSL